jgi:hypothetical protein
MWLEAPDRHGRSPRRPMCRGSIDPNSLKESPMKRIILIGLVGLIGLCAYLTLGNARD